MPNALQLIEFLSHDPLTNGHQHGEMFRREIKDLAEIRLERMCSLSIFKNPKEALSLAEKHLPILQKFDAALMTELLGISEASDVSLARLVILNHYTDMRDITEGMQGTNDLGENPEDLGGCSIIFSPGSEGKILGQTWDIHASAMDYVVLLKINDTLVFSVVGCLGMTGMNKHGVAVCINNLNSHFGQVGVVWPALVRKILLQKSAKLGHQVLMAATISSGRHYAIADENDFFATEVSSTAKVIITKDAQKPYFHTNHCLDEKMAKEHYIREGSNTLWRYDHLTSPQVGGRISTQREVFLALKEVSMQAQKNQLHQMATCGTIVMNINKRSMLACSGMASEELLKWPQTLRQI